MTPRTLDQLVPFAAATHPRRAALVGLSQTLSWQEVEDRTARLAGLLMRHGVQRGDRVAVLRPKGHESFEAVHAVLRAGGIMVPLDPMAPASTIGAVLADSGARAIIGHAPTIKRGVKATDHVDLDLVLTTGDCSTVTADTAPNVIDINDLANHSRPESFPSLSPDDPAYLIYTSGSTGLPKGILHTHGSGMAYARAAVETHEVTELDRLAAMTGLHFDMSTFELYALPLAGAAIVQMSEPQLRFPASFTERAASESTTIWYAVTFLLQQILERGALPERDWASLRTVMFAGEVFPPADLRNLMAALPHTTFENVYGPAEVNASNVYRVLEPPADGDVVPVGPACGEAELLVVDDDERPVPAGTKGILWISAPTLMREYWNRPDLTETSTRSNGARPDWYVSGDVVSQDADGIVRFHGRRDHQVKLRGIRVELEGVEATLTDHPLIRHAVVGPWAGQPGTLALAAVAVAGADLDLRTIQRWAAGRLPPVAIPACLELFDDFPLTPSGKIDRKLIRNGICAVKEPV